MKFRHKTCAVALAWLLLFPLPDARACTGFSFGTGETWTVGNNIGWYTPVRFGWVVNKRNMRKVALVLNSQDRPLSWVSHYASLTLNPIGREFPSMGVNEAGLVVQGLELLSTAYIPPDPDLPNISTLQWIQYQLDTAATVEQVVAQTRGVRVSSAFIHLHYFVCDANEKCATLEFIDGALVIHEGNDFPQPALTNHTYQQGMDAYLRYMENGSLPDEDSLVRFVRAVVGMHSYQTGSVLDYGFYVLSQVVSQPNVRAGYSVVHRPQSRAVYFRHNRSESSLLQLIRFENFSPDCASPAQVLLPDPQGFGDMTGRFVEYSAEFQENLVAQYNGTLPPLVIRRLVAYPSETECMNLETGPL